MSEYAERDIIEQGDYYSRHTSAMTAEGLDRKSDIAAELAHRDIQITTLRQQLADAADQVLVPVAYRVTGSYTNMPFRDRSSAEAYLQGLLKSDPDGGYRITPLYERPTGSDTDE